MDSLSPVRSLRLRFQQVIGKDSTMKIICSWCKKFLGEKEPFKDQSETHAKCPECIEKQRQEEEALKKVSGDGKEYIVENGLKGFLTIAGKESEVLNFGEMIVSGKKIVCLTQTREDLEAYLNSLPGDEVDMTSLHSTTITLPPSTKGRRKKNAPKEVEEKPKENVTYNFTARVPKGYVLACYDFEKNRMEEVTQLLAEMAFSAYVKSRGKPVEENPDR